jgi:hypothetical protein
MVNSEELIGTTENLTLYMGCGINRCRCNRNPLYFQFHIVSCPNELCIRLLFILFHMCR